MIRGEVFTWSISHFMINIFNLIKHILIIYGWFNRLLWWYLTLILSKEILIFSVVIRSKFLIYWVLNINCWGILNIKIIEVVLLSVSIIWLSYINTLRSIIVILDTFRFFYNISRFLFILKCTRKIIDVWEFHITLWVLLVCT